MNILKIEDHKCRICLAENASLDWNDSLNDSSHLTYKYCYYKYTQLECFDGDNLYLSTKLCPNCSNDLQHINAFISKAIETNDLLQEKLSLNIINEKDVKLETTNFETVLMDETAIETGIPNVIISEQSGEENQKESEASDSSKRYQKIEPRRIQRKRRKAAKKHHEQENIISGEVLLKKKKNHCSKPWEIPTCCSICSKVLTSKYKAIQHEQIHLENRKRTETCAECGLKFYNKSSLRSHMLTHIENREKAHKCEFCDKAFYNKSALNTHRRIHLGQMIKCSLCTKEYPRQVDLDQHMFSHSVTSINGDLKPKKKIFVCCEICGENVRSINYKSHTAKHMNEPLCKCAVCNKEFFSRDSCVSHLKKFHKKASGERSHFIIAYKKSRCSNLFLQQNTSKIFVKE